jgi:hypothetical protein
MVIRARFIAVSYQFKAKIQQDRGKCNIAALAELPAIRPLRDAIDSSSSPIFPITRCRLQQCCFDIFLMA